MRKVISKDGTNIAFDQTGQGPAIILVGGALQTRIGNAGLAALLEPHFSVFNYDRRGRGDSDDIKQYSVEDEIEDIKALIGKAGGSAYVFGSSSGANLALEAARQLTITVSTLVLDGGTTLWLSAGAGAIAKVLPNAKRQTLKGQTHDVAADALAPALVEFFKG